MKISAKFCSIGAALIAAVGLSSCVTYESVSYEDGPVRTTQSTSSSFTVGASQSWGDPHGFHRDSFEGSRREDLCHDDRPCPHCGSKHGCKHQHHNDDHRKEEKKKKLKHHPKSYQIVGGSTGSKVRPRGFHSISWYKSRGYDVKKLKLRNEKGEYYRGR